MKKEAPNKRKAAQVNIAEKSEKDLLVRLFRNTKAWEAWLARHFNSSAGLWLRLAKKAADLQSVSYQEALEVALCFGWIDGQKKSFDDESWLQKFTPRGPKSIWSKINRAKALELIEKGRMRAAGFAAIEQARESGQWEAAYDSHRTAAPPDDFVSALNKSPRAKAFFATLNSQNRFAILFRIQTARKPETRQKRIDQFIRMLEKHEKLYP
jgi:uncharacterized protein YdeI (YjbR/CyaY-like superfamily)